MILCFQCQTVKISIWSELSLPLIVNDLLFWSVSAGTCVHVCPLAPGGRGLILRRFSPDLKFSYSACLSDTKNTAHSYDRSTFYPESFRGHTSNRRNNYLRQVSLSAACRMCNLVFSVKGRVRSFCYIQFYIMPAKRSRLLGLHFNNERRIRGT